MENLRNYDSGDEATGAHVVVKMKRCKDGKRPEGLQCMNTDTQLNLETIIQLHQKWMFHGCGIYRI